MTTFGKAKFQLHVYLPEETDKAIRRLAQLENRTLTRQFVMLIEEALAARAAAVKAIDVIEAKTVLKGLQPKAKAGKA